MKLIMKVNFIFFMNFYLKKVISETINSFINIALILFLF